MPLLRENRLRLLSAAEQEDPQLVLENFFESFHLYEAQEMLDLLKKVMMTSLRNKGQREQENWLFFLEKLEKLVETGWVLRPKPGIMPKVESHTNISGGAA